MHPLIYKFLGGGLLSFSLFLFFSIFSHINPAAHHFWRHPSPTPSPSLAAGGNALDLHPRNNWRRSSPPRQGILGRITQGQRCKSRRGCGRARCGWWPAAFDEHHPRLQCPRGGRRASPFGDPHIQRSNVSLPRCRSVDGGRG
jgi:hypothetical protein